MTARTNSNHAPAFVANDIIRMYEEYVAVERDLNGVLAHPSS
jgi:hypothetical protein